LLSNPRRFAAETAIYQSHPAAVRATRCSCARPQPQYGVLQPNLTWRTSGCVSQSHAWFDLRTITQSERGCCMLALAHAGAAASVELSAGSMVNRTQIIAALWHTEATGCSATAPLKDSALCPITLSSSKRMLRAEVHPGHLHLLYPQAPAHTPQAAPRTPVYCCVEQVTGRIFGSELLCLAAKQQSIAGHRPPPPLTLRQHHGQACP